MRVFTFLSIGVLLLCSSCSDTLTTQEATEIISSHFPKYCTNKRATKKIYEYPDSPMRQKAYNKKILKVFNTLEQLGLATIKSEGYNPRKHTLELTEEAKKKYGGAIPITEYEFVEIVGVSQNGNEATVKYTYKSMETLFFDLQKTNEKPTCWEGKWTQVLNSDLLHRGKQHLFDDVGEYL